MRSVRLLPIVIFAALALLIFKGIGLATNGGYVLTGTTAVVAQEGGGDAATSDASAATPMEATISDAAPTISESEPTVAVSKEVASSSSAAEFSSASGASSSSSGASDATASSSAAVATLDTIHACPDQTTPPPGAAAAVDATASAPAADCPSTPVNANGDALPTTVDGTGRVVPLTSADGDSQAALLQRLSARRAELDKRQADLDIREATIAAAEQRLDEKTKQLADLQAQVSALVDQKQAAEDAGFKGIVQMYEQMKPKDAAKIFNTLDLNVMLKIARAMNPRKVAPVLAAMDQRPADALTTALAITDTPDVTAQSTPTGGQNLSQLPQIVGQ